MNKISLVFTTFVLFCSYHNSSAQESKNCECDILQISKSGKITNFTKQSGKINGRPFYFSITDYQEDIVWWNHTASSWMFQKYFEGREVWTTRLEVKQDIDCPNFSNTTSWAVHPQANNGEIKSRCLPDKSKCSLKKGEFDSNPYFYCM